MRIKIIFFPLTVALSILIFIVYIWPEIGNIRESLNKLEKSQSDLQDILNKKSNIEKLKQSLAASKDKEDSVLKFLPSSQKEEEIISGINYLATDSAVSLAGLNFKEQKTGTVTGGKSNEATSSKDVLFSSGEDEELSELNKKEILKSAESEILVVGGYDNIRTFLEQVYKMEQYNDISSFSISTSEASEGTGEEAARPGALSATASVNFGYMPMVSVGRNYSYPIFSQSSFNFTPYNEMKSFIREKIPSLEVGETGRTNPFLP